MEINKGDPMPNLNEVRERKLFGGGE